MSGRTIGRGPKKRNNGGTDSESVLQIWFPDGQVRSVCLRRRFQIPPCKGCTGGGLSSPRHVSTSVRSLRWFHIPLTPVEFRDRCAGSVSIVWDEAATSCLLLVPCVKACSLLSTGELGSSLSCNRRASESTRIPRQVATPVWVPNEPAAHRTEDPYWYLGLSRWVGGDQWCAWTGAVHGSCVAGHPCVPVWTWHGSTLLHVCGS